MARSPFEALGATFLPLSRLGSTRLSIIFRRLAKGFKEAKEKGLFFLSFWRQNCLLEVNRQDFPKALSKGL
jgi:hypothetical protein